jgi:hypothetical protein
LAHKSLLSGYGKGLKKIHKPQVLAAIRDTEGVRIPSLWARWVATILLPAIIVAQLSPAFAEFAGVIA